MFFQIKGGCRIAAATIRFLFAEVALEQASEGLAVSCFVAGHFVDGPIVPLRSTLGWLHSVLRSFH